MPFVILNTSPLPSTAIVATDDGQAPVTPHVQMPFALNANGRVTYCDQDSSEDVQSCVLNLLGCQQGLNPYDPNFGRPDFRGEPLPLQTASLKAAVKQYEPRVNDLAIEQALSTIAGTAQLVVSGDVSTS